MYQDASIRTIKMALNTCILIHDTNYLILNTESRCEHSVRFSAVAFDCLLIF